MVTHQTPSQHRAMLTCRDFILYALQSEAQNREGRDVEDWVETERTAVAVAANVWAESHFFDQRVTTADVEHIETTAVGHVDYATKLALRVAEVIVGAVPLDAYSRHEVH